MDDISTRVKTVIGAHMGLDAAVIDDDIHFIDDLGIDSLDAIELVMALESQFGLIIRDSDFIHFAIVEDVIVWVRANMLQAYGLQQRRAG